MAKNESCKVVIEKKKKRLIKSGKDRVYEKKTRIRIISGKKEVYSEEVHKQVKFDFGSDGKVICGRKEIDVHKGDSIEITPGGDYQIN